MPSRDYASGQVWAYRTRPGEEGSRLRIHSVETPPGSGEPVFHLSLSGLGVSLGHLPVGRETLDASVTALADAGDADFPDPSEGIETWRRDEGGVFTIPLADIVQALADAVAGFDPGVRYMRLDYVHEQPDTPDCLVFEVQADGSVTRMLHLFEDGRFGAFNAAEEGTDNLIDGGFFELWGWLEEGVPVTQDGETVTLSETRPADFEELWRDLEEASANPPQ